MNWKNILTWVSRIAVGGLFIFSGLIKANDPYGFGYKLDEYFDIFHFESFKSISVGLSIIICIAEVMMGVWLLIGYMTRLNVWLLLLLIIFFDFLTGYTALANYAKENPSTWYAPAMASMMHVEKPEMINALSDCGCFGDFIKLKPFQSFLKDLLLTAFIIILFIRKNTIQPLFNNTISGITTFTTGIIAVAFPIYTFMYLPVKDFLPYKEGTDIVKAMEIPKDALPGVMAMTYHYKNKQTGELKDITVLSPEDPKALVGLEEETKDLKISKITELPVSDSIWVKNGERTEIQLREDPKSAIHDFKLYDKDNNEFTDMVTEMEGYKLLMIAINFETVDPTYIDNFIKTANDLSNNGKTKVMAMGITSSSIAKVDSILKIHKGSNIKFYNLDLTQVKSMIRANPGYMLLNKATVIKKWGKYALPSAETVTKYIK